VKLHKSAGEKALFRTEFSKLTAVEPVFLDFDSTGNVERTISFNQADREM